MVIEPGYLTVSVTDVGPAMAFYTGLFGWSFDHEEGTQSAHVNNTRLPLGLAGRGQVDIRFVYFRVEDIAAGKVLEENEFPSGLNAVCADDQGTIFSLWQPAPGF